MKLIIQNLEPNKTGHVQLMPLGDLHLGARNCLEDLIQEKITKCLKEKIYVIGMGDMIEMATKSSPGSGVFEQSEPQEQMEMIIELFQPLHDAGLLLGMLKGNHEVRANKAAGMNVTKMMCKAIGTKYLNGACNALLRAGKVSYRVHATHGSASGGTMQGKMNGALKVFNYIRCDLVLYAHTHGLNHSISKFYEISKKRKVLETKYKHAVLTGSFLGYRGSYAEDKNMIPAIAGCPIINFNTKEHKIIVDL